MTVSRTLGPGLYGFQEINVGDKIYTSSQQITAEMIDRFADLSGDHYVLHMDRSEALARGFRDRVAHGLLVLSVVDGLKNNAEAQLDGLASLGWNWRFEQPVFAGDVIQSEQTIKDKRTTHTGKRGIIGIHFDVENQTGVKVQSGQNELIFNL